MRKRKNRREEEMENVRKIPKLKNIIEDSVSKRYENFFNQKKHRKKQDRGILRSLFFIVKNIIEISSQIKHLFFFNFFLQYQQNKESFDIQEEFISVDLFSIEIDSKQ